MQINERQLAEALATCQAHKATQSLTANLAEALAPLAVAAILDAWQQHGPLPEAAVTLLCELATSANEQVQRLGIRALFPQVIETLNDSFRPDACAYYDELFARIIGFCRQLPAAQAFHSLLNQFGLTDENAILKRKRKCNLIRPYVGEAPIRKVILFSRVTIGADVAINSVLLAALQVRFPQAEFVLFGSPKLQELFGGNERVRVRELRYARGGDLLSRLNAWCAVVEAVTDEIKTLPRAEVLVVDADSRLTQLGLLPVVADDENYFYFESRGYGTLSRQSLATLTAAWAGRVFEAPTDTPPQLALPSSFLALGQQLRQRACEASSTWLATVSWGVGGNARKRLDEPFEAALLALLLDADASGLPPCKIILDKGGDSAEREQIERLIQQLRSLGKGVVSLDEATLRALPDTEKIRADVIAWDGGIGALAGLIAASDVYIGYDSAGQHLAAALGTPTLTLFVNSNNVWFAERWRPTGSGWLATINVDASDWEQGNVVRNELLAQAQAHLKTLAKTKTREPMK